LEASFPLGWRTSNFFILLLLLLFLFFRLLFVPQTVKEAAKAFLKKGIYITPKKASEWWSDKVPSFNSQLFSLFVV